MSKQIEARSKKGLEQQRPVTLRALYYGAQLPRDAEILSENGILYRGDLDPNGDAL
jgi:hypothetical protein